MTGRFLSFIAATALLTAPLLADTKVPLVVGSNGQASRLQAGTTLQTSVPTSAAASLNLPHGAAPSSPANGDCWTQTAGLYCRVNGTTIPVAIPSASANSFLGAPDGSPGLPSYRALVTGDMPSDMSAINATSVSQTQSLGNWLTYLGGKGVVPGCVGDGVANDTTCLQAAINSHQNGILYLGTGLYKVTSGLTSAGQITIIGSGGGQGQYNRTCLRGIRSATATINVLTFQASGSRLYNTCMDTSVTPSSGAYILVNGAANSVIISDNQLNDPFVGVLMSGITTTQNVNGVIARNVITPVNNSSAAAITIGANSTGGNTVDTYISENTIYCNNSARGMVFNDAGGSLVTANAIYGCSVGTTILPSTSQIATWLYFTGTVVGDTSTTADLLIDTAAASAGINGLQFTGSWTASATAGPTVLIKDTGASSNVLGIHFVGHRSYPAAGQIGFDVRAGQKFTLDSSTVCSGGTSAGIGVQLSAAVSDSAIRNNSIGSCDHPVAGSLATAISVTQTGGFVGIIRGNDLANATTALSYAPTPGNASTATIAGNIGLDNGVASLASAATITLTPTPYHLLTGTTTVTTINGAWSGREVTMVPTDAAGLTFNTGGNLCNSVVATQNQPVRGFYDGGSGCWRIR